jgi:hypothetical protein
VSDDVDPREGGPEIKGRSDSPVLTDKLLALLKNLTKINASTVADRHTPGYVLGVGKINTFVVDKLITAKEATVDRTATYVFTGVLAMVLLAVWSSAGMAYSTYTGSQCAVCHSGFVNKGALHDLHTDLFASNNCDMCHPTSPGSKPVSTSSAGDATAFSCLGCHGRDYGGAVGLQAAGLRLHHANANPPVTSCGFCHSDPVPRGEADTPPHYGRPDLNLSLSCGDALDNDGDFAYDGGDTDCTSPTDHSTWGRIKALFDE